MLVPSRSERLIPRMLGPRPVCLKWVMIRHCVMSVVPLSNRTFISTLSTSALCHKRTSIMRCGSANSV